MPQSKEHKDRQQKIKSLFIRARKNSTALSRIRVTVEHVFGDIKIFGIMKDVYRNFLDPITKNLSSL